MPDTGKERRWPERIWHFRRSDNQMPAGFAVEPSIGEPATKRSEPYETETYVPEAALAKARKEGREEVREALDWALHWIVANGCVPDDMPGALPSEIEAFDKADSLLDSLTKEGD